MACLKQQHMKQLLKEGYRLIVLADFDHTLTRATSSTGEYCAITHEIFPESHPLGDSTLGEQQKKMNISNSNRERHLEKGSPELVKLYEDWWNESHSHISACNFSTRDLSKFVRESSLQLRSNFEQFASLLRRNHIPLTIYSGGIKEVIEIVLQPHYAPGNKDSGFVVANTFEVSDEDTIVGFGTDLVHSLNKDGRHLSNYSSMFADTVVLLLGNSLTDPMMADRIEPQPKMVYKIGFCDSEDPSTVAAFTSVYDLVLVNDASMDGVITVVRELLGDCEESGAEQVSEADRAAALLEPAEPVEEPSSDEITLPLPISDMTIAFSSLLSLPHIHCKDRATVERKLRDVVADGIDKLMVISDFDYTLSRAVDEEGVRCWTTHGVFDNCADQVAADLSKKFRDLKDHFYPIEFDPHMSIEEKTPHMETWWRTSHGYIVDAGFTKPTIEKFVKESKIELRSSTEQWMRSLTAANVPLVVFSAGLGDIIDIFFRHKFGKVPENVHLIANMMKFCEEGIVREFSEPLIHTFCKNSSVIGTEASFFHSTADRHNILLMGDSLGDLHMDVGVEKAGHTLKIGFLNFYTDDLMEKFLDGYDIVVLNDQTIDVPQRITEMVQAVTVKSEGA